MDEKGGEPFNIPFFKERDIQLLREVMTSIKQIVNNCTLVYGYEFAYEDVDDQTDNFIRYHVQYKEFYFKNYKLAMEQGLY